MATGPWDKGRKESAQRTWKRNKEGRRDENEEDKERLWSSWPRQRQVDGGLSHTVSHVLPTNDDNLMAPEQQQHSSSWHESKRGVCFTLPTRVTPGPKLVTLDMLINSSLCVHICPMMITTDLTFHAPEDRKIIKCQACNSFRLK